MQYPAMAPSSHLPNQDCKTVFIIDGDPDSADTLVTLFDLLGHRVVSVEDNARLRAALSQTVPDIAIVNLDSRASIRDTLREQLTLYIACHACSATEASIGKHKRGIRIAPI